MAHIHDVKIGNNSYLIEPTLYGAATISDSGANYTVSLTNFELNKATGVAVQVKFPSTNVENAKLNVNSTGAKSIFYNGAAISASVLKANHTYTLVYDGTQWQLVGDIDTNTWRGIADNLTSSTATTTSLSAKQGYLLANGSARDNTKILKVNNVTDEAIIRFNGTDGEVQNSLVTIDDNGHMYFGAEKAIHFRMNRKKDGGGGWAQTYLRIYDNANNIFVKFGIYGENDNFSYLFFGPEDYSSTKNLKVFNTGRVRVLSLDFNGTASYGGETQPIYWKDGVPVAGTSIGASAYHADSYFALASHGNHVPTTQTANNITFLRNDNSWYKLTQTEVNTLINLLGTGSSDLTANDYVITQYVGGGTTTTSYHRRPASKVVNSTLVKAALGTVATTAKKFLKDTGSWIQVDWGDLTGKPDSFTPASHTHSHLVSLATINSGDSNNNNFKSAIKKYFDDNKSTVPRNSLVNFYSSAYNNGSEVFGYYLSGYDSNPYGGFFIAHYDTPRYVGILNGTYTESKLARIDIGNTITSGQIMISDGTDGKIKSSGYTIAKSVPSNAVFTDTNKYHKTGSWGGTNDLTYTATAVNSADALAFTLATASTSTYGVTKLSAAADNSGLAATAKSVYDLDIKVDGLLAATNAMIFKGTLGTGGTITALPATHNAGDTYRVITAGTWAGKTCVVGDLIICIKDGTTAADADWTSVETNEDGAVIGPATANSTTDNAIVRWDNTAGRVIQNSKITIDDNGNISFPSDSTSSTFPSHYYTRPYDTNGNTYVHYYSSSLTTSTYSYANLRVKNDNSFKVLKFGGDGTFTWDGNNVLTSGNTYAEKTDNTAVTVTCGTAATIATINSKAVKINVTKPTYTYSDVGALSSSTIVNKVKQTVKSDNINYKILASAAGASPTSGTNYEAIYDTNVTVNPSTSTVNAVAFNGKLTTTRITQPALTGSGTTAVDAGASNTSTRYKPAVWTFNAGITPTDGDIVNIKQPCAGHDYGTWLTLDNGTTYYPVVYCSSSRITTHFSNGNAIKLYFDAGGTASVFARGGAMSRTTVTGVWRVMTMYDSNSNDTGYYHRRIYPNLKAGGAIHPYSIIMQLSNGKWSSITTTAPNNPGTSSVSPVATGKTASTSGYLLGHVLLMYANTTYADTNNIGTYNIWSAHTGLIDARYSFNLANSTGNGFVAYTPVYLVGTIVDGLFYLDTTKWWIQTLPTSDDGKVYIYIGDAYDWYRLTFTEDKPIYWYKDGAVRLYGDYATSSNRAAITTTTNAIAYYTDTAGTFGTKASANGVLYATAANGALNWGTLPVAQGGTGATDAATARTNLGITLANLGAAASSHTHPVSQLTWGGGVNLTTSATANNQEWSIDLTPSTYTGTYWHVWSAKNSKSILACYTDTNAVKIENGPLFIKTIQKTTRVYPWVASSERSKWYKVTFPYYNATTDANNAKWFMNSFDLHFGGGYASNPTGVAHVTFYWTRAKSNGAWTLGQVSAKFDGILMNKIKLYYRTAEPGILYINNESNVYNGVWLDNLYVDDTSPNLDWSTTTIATCNAITSETDPALSAYTQIPSVYTYTNNSTTYHIDNATQISKNLILYSASGDSPALVFKRASDSTLTDWRIYVTSGKLSFCTALDAATWTERAYFKDNSAEFVVNKSITAGAKETSTAPSSETAVDRIIITPYYHTGGPWKITSADDNTNAFLKLFYGSSELIKIKHDGTFMNSLKASITGNAATITATAETGNYSRPIWFSCHNGTSVVNGKLGYDTDFTYNPSSNNVNFAANATITASAGKTLGISTTTGAMTIGTTTGALTVQTNGASGGNLVLQTVGNSGTVTLKSTKSSVSILSGTTMSIQSSTSTSISSATTMSISSTTSTSISATTTMSISSGSGKTTTINSGSTMYLQRTSTASIIFCSGGTAVANYHGRLNASGNLALETGTDNAGTQNTHKLYVKGDSAFEGKIAFATAASNAITNKAYMQWNATDLSIDFIFE